MKLSDLHENFYADQDRDHIYGLIEEFLFERDHSMKLTRALDGMSDPALEKLKGLLYNEAMDSHSYSTDYGSEIDLSEESILRALQQMGAL